MTKQLSILFAIGACLSAGCARYHASSDRVRLAENKQVLLNVPFYPDEGDQCGPAALASVMEYWGKPERPARLKQEVFKTHLRDLPAVDLKPAAESRGLSVELADGSLVRVKRELESGHPLIAFVVSSDGESRYFVITGYDDEQQCIFAHTGKNRDERIAYSEFDEQWRKTDRWALLILPPRH
jgi:ABC-type bacteriocin/lantibiotic exporter with double-glycine peptidase domain